MTMSCLLIEAPPFVFYPHAFVTPPSPDPILKPLNTTAQIIQVVAVIFKHLKFVLLSLVESCSLVSHHLGSSFRSIVFGAENRRYPALSSLYLVAFKIYFWLFSVAISFFITAASCYSKKNAHTTDTHPHITRFADNEINPVHLTCSNKEISDDHVDPEIQVRSLIKAFKKINFDNPSAPGYVDITRERDDGSPVTVAQLERNLTTFVTKIETRAAFIGTPPAHDLPGLMMFYNTVQTSVRVALGDAEENIKKFIAQHGSDVATYTAEQLREYKNLLETRNRLVIDFAHAGAHCGGRYMGEATQKAQELSNRNGTDISKTFGELISLALADTRKRIAEEQISKMGNDVHSYSAFMATLGPTLGIPGSKGVVEHLGSIQPDQQMQLFFKNYTVDCIINTVQKAVSSSQELREKLSDWLKEQVGDWNRETYAEQARTLINSITAILEEDPSTHLQKVSQGPLNILEAISFFCTLETTTKEGLPVKDTGVISPKDDWENYLEERLASDTAKAHMRELGQHKGFTKTIELRTQLQMVRNTCMQSPFREELISQVIKWHAEKIPLNPEDPNILNAHKNAHKIEQITRVCNEHGLPLEREEVIRIVEHPETLRAKIEAESGLERGRQFLKQLTPYIEVTERQQDDRRIQRVKGLRPAVLEWLLVSQRILYPQSS